MTAKKKSGKATSKLSEAFEKVTKPKPKEDSGEVAKQKAHIKILESDLEKFIARRSGARWRAQTRLDDARKHLETLI